MTHDLLELAEENYTYQLRQALAAVDARSASGEDLATIALSYRILGICALLREADAERFATLLCKAGQARLQLLQVAGTGQRLPPALQAASGDVGLGAALAAGDFATAARIAALSPSTHVDGFEDEEDFLFFHFLHQLLRTPVEEDALRRTLDRWTRVVDDEPTPYLSICQALLDADEAAFLAALEEVLEARKDSLRRYRRQLDFDRELHATEGKVYVNGLALVRLAESRGLSVPERYELLPRLARAARSPPLPEDAWRSP
jgi:hypothetical protein